ncbi:uncharacterized protein NP_1652A [Natronomonas pharaonis DSM 2160]|uniref:Uncharacterized protein n=1 Tax=Natronomonas pharaonis (strain ATCC 35678 / DSM 2160 / CIP 103997 / JCM 8858 / NBRC 14720 / NCIMB 2260 / Gabara) TaxID=348780 RepID=A0A1U7EV72_NATPD|nr:hypothetical protein [Natronomonas pharaonis]CAI48917.1 uncharacterized protein NP_1652A [Natronomonas pharaonis DSM 2160]
MTRKLSRRQLVSGLAAAGAGVAAGCTDGEEGDSEDEEDTDIDPGLAVGDRALSSAFPLELYEPGTDERVATVHWHGPEFSHWHFGPLEIPAGDSRTLQAQFNADGGGTIDIGEGEPYAVSVGRTEATPEELLSVSVAGDEITVSGGESGEGELVFQLRHEGDVVWVSPPLSTDVAGD